MSARSHEFFDHTGCPPLARRRQGSGVLQRIGDGEAFRPRRRQQSIIGRDKHGRWEPIRLESLPDGERTGQMQSVIRPQGMRLHERIGLEHARWRDRHQAVRVPISN